MNDRIEVVNRHLIEYITQLNPKNGIIIKISAPSIINIEDQRFSIITNLNDLNTIEQNRFNLIIADLPFFSKYESASFNPNIRVR